MQKKLGIVALATAAILALSACGGAGTATGAAGSPDSGELSFGMWNQKQADVMKTVVSDFNKDFPNIKVKIEVTPYKEYWTKLQTQASSGTEPDVFWMNGPNFQLYASNGLLEPQDDLIADHKIDPAKYPKALVDLYNYDGKQYGVPKDFDAVGLWYNKEIFDKAAEAYPTDQWSWQDYQGAAARISEKLKSDGIFGTSLEAGEGQGTFYNTIPQAGGEVISADKKTSGYDSPAAIEGLKFWSDLMANGSAPTIQQLSDTTGDQWFANGKAAMIYSESFQVATYLQSPNKDKFQVVAMPAGVKQATVTHGIANVISAKSKNKAAAKTLATYLAGEAAAKTWAKSGVVIPAYEGSQEAWVKSVPNWNLQVFVDAATKYGVAYPVSKNTSAWTKLEAEVLANLWSGKITAAEAGQSLAAKMNAVLAKENG